MIMGSLRKSLIESGETPGYQRADMDADSPLELAEFAEASPGH
jgi:hypothetical protein